MHIHEKPGCELAFSGPCCVACWPLWSVLHAGSFGPFRVWILHGGLQQLGQASFLPGPCWFLAVRPVLGFNVSAERAVPGACLCFEYESPESACCPM